MYLVSVKIILIFGLLNIITQSAYDWKNVDAKIIQKIGQGHFSGCVLGVYSDNATLVKKTYGNMVPRWGLYSPPVTMDTVFDANYLTQVLGINSGLMQLYDQQRINVTDRVSKHFYDFDNNGKRYLTITNLMIHNSGLQSTMPQPFGTNATDLLKKINTLKLEYKQETKFQFSQLGFVVLGQMVAKLNNKTLEASLFEILVQAGLRQTKFKPTLNSHLIAPSFYNKGTIRGMPSNKIAYFLNGVAGNAGLFTILDNVGYYMQLLLNKGKPHLGTRVFSQQVVDLFTTKIDVKAYNNTRALGWDTVPLVDPPCGKKFSKKSFGFSDPLGSYIWADKQKKIAIVLLAAGGGFPVPNGRSHAKAQGEISDVIMTTLGY